MYFIDFLKIDIEEGEILSDSELDANADGWAGYTPEVFCV